MPDRCISDGINFGSNNGEESIKALYHTHIRAKGHFIVVKPYVRPVKTGEVMLPESLRAEDMHHSVAAQVIDIGPTAYTDEKFCGGIAWADIGDWVFIPRVAGSRVGMKNEDGSDIVFRIVREDDIIAIISDPSEWEIRINATKY